jgi:hypothetical protein
MNSWKCAGDVEYELEDFSSQSRLTLGMLQVLSELTGKNCLRFLAENSMGYFHDEAKKIGRSDAGTVQTLAMLQEIRDLIRQAKDLESTLADSASEWSDNGEELVLKPVASQRAPKATVRKIDAALLAKAIADEVHDFLREVRPFKTAATEVSGTLLFEQAEKIAGAADKLIANLTLMHNVYAFAAGASVYKKVKVGRQED